MTKRFYLVPLILFVIFIFIAAYFNRFLFLDLARRSEGFFKDALIETEKSPDIQNDIKKIPVKKTPAQKIPAPFHLLISEVCAGFDSSKNEFIEIYNPNDFLIVLSDENFILEMVNSKNQKTKKRIQWLNNTIPKRGYFVFVGGKIQSGEKTLLADATFSAQLTSVSGVIISDKTKIYDKVSWGQKNRLPPKLAIEGEGIILERGLLTGNSLERKKINQVPIDSDKNQNDFILNVSPNPQNSLGDKIFLPQPTIQ